MTRTFCFTSVEFWVPHCPLWDKLLEAVIAALCKSSLSAGVAIGMIGFSS